MSRLKSYYSADEITNNLYALSNEWMTADNIEYIGAYHKYSTGEVYTQATWNPAKSVKLVKFEDSTTDKFTYKKLNPSKKLKYQTPVNMPTIITQNNINSGAVIRYFLQKRNSQNIIEINQDQFSKWKIKQIDNIMYNGIKLPWYITGPKSDTFKNNVKIIGVKTKNIQQVKNANKKMPGIQKLLTNPLQYYTDTTFIKPIDINGLDS